MSKLLKGRFFGSARTRRQVGELALIESHHDAGSRLPRHSHEHAYFCLNFGGTYVEQYGRQRRTCRTGMVVFHPPGECHAEDHESAVASLNVELERSWLRRVAEIARPLDQPAEFFADDIAAAGAEILRELHRDDPDSALAIEALTWEILIASARQPAHRLDTRAPRWLRRACDALDAQPTKSVSLRAIAAEADVHPVHFAATFRRFLGCSVGQYQRRQRFEYACRLLRRRDLSLADVAVDAGFADQSHFTRTFKRLTGTTPKAYRTFLAFKTVR